ncbi:MAG TPA: motility protein A [Firmicutes bacterium]|nr:motility protein A [Bacillota bacterium]
MDISTCLGLLMGFIAVTVVASTGGEGGIRTFLDLMSAILVLGGATAALFVNFPLPHIYSALKDLKYVFFKSKLDSSEVLAATLVEMAGKARRQGILALEDDLAEMPEGLMRRGIEKLLDGSSPENLRKALETELSIADERWARSREIFESMGAYLPVFGMIGTILGLVKMCANLDDPKNLGPSFALALVTTLYGAVMANLIFLPIAGKLKVYGERAMFNGAMIIEGLTAISSGANPRVVEEMLQIYVANDPGESKKPVAAPVKPTEAGVP